MRKLMWFSIGFASAAAIGMYLLQGSWYFLASGAAALLLAVSLWLMLHFPKFRLGVAVLLGCVIGFVWLSVFEYVYLSVPRVVDEKRVVMTLTATDYSRPSDYGTVVQGVGKLDGKLYTMRIYLPKNMEIAPGDQLTTRYLLRSALPGGSANSSYQISHGTFLTAKAFRQPDVSESEKLPWYGYPAFVREHIKLIIHQTLPEDAAGFAIALLIGDTDGLDYDTDTSFKISGISHVVAVSGFHVTVLFSMIYFLVGKKRFLAAGLGLPVLFFFAAVAGFSGSIMRACLMHSLMIISLLIDKEYDPPTALSFAVLAMLVANPWAVINVGFQLSVSCMIGIMLFSEPVKNWLMDDKRLGRIQKRWKKYAVGFASSVGMTIGATLMVSPLCAVYFGMVSLVSVLTNLLTSWIITAIFYGLMLVCLSGLIWLPMGSIVGWVISWPIRYVLLTARVLAGLPVSAVYMDSIYMLLWLVFSYVVLTMFLVSKSKPIFLSLMCATLGLCIALLASWLQPCMDECRVTVLDVGQGQCILLQSQGKTFLVDCGGDSETRAADTAVRTLLSQGIFRLDGVILTHFDADHAAGVSYLLGRIPANILYLPNCADEDSTVGPMLSAHTGYALTVTQNLSICFGEAKITLIPSRSNLSDNESGLCVLFQTKNCDILITGDRSISGERELMQSICLPKLELLIVGHHGSKYSTGKQLLQLTQPEVAIISVGEDNLFGHPTEETLQRLQESGCMIYRTDIHGTIIFRR